MKKQHFFLTLILIFNYNCKAQDKTNPIVFSDTFFGYSVGSSEGFNLGLNLNYQRKDDLFTVRYILLTKFEHDPNAFIFPIFRELEHINEFAFLYGKRFIKNSHSWSFSSGLSYVNRTTKSYDKNNNYTFEKSQLLGIPFEINIKWFNSQKERYRVFYGLIPIGKPTGYARSIGFKLFGDVSKTSFIGIGLTYGSGWHKNY